jgi:ABC-type bacteriocin/lantibiotic exporter with double-glycine peptidase domain
MRNLVTLAITTVALAACEGQYQTSAEYVDDIQIQTLPGATRVKSSMGSERLVESQLTRDQLISRNYLFAEYYLKAADRVQLVNHVSNVTLLSYGAGVAIDATTALAEVTAKRTMAGLFADEILNYTNPREVARALRMISEESACIASAADNDENATVADILLAMQYARTNLRDRMTRDRKGFGAIVDRFSKDDADALYKEDRIDTKNKLAVVEAEADAAKAKIGFQRLHKRFNRQSRGSK